MYRCDVATRLTGQSSSARRTAKFSGVAGALLIVTHTANDVADLREGVLRTRERRRNWTISRTSEPTIKARATARFAGGRGNELLIQVYI
jgi:hypothetical protein